MFSDFNPESTVCATYRKVFDLLTLKAGFSLPELSAGGFIPRRMA
ncbi:hypothetical protein QUF80_16110 [Desulfococcaceae bacterium HSG8]|nr:hypothetical protein [Desulfococcaceae bacterium HSG8]